MRRAIIQQFHEQFFSAIHPDFLTGCLKTDKMRISILSLTAKA